MIDQWSPNRAPAKKAGSDFRSFSLRSDSRSIFVPTRPLAPETLTLVSMSGQNAETSTSSGRLGVS